VKPAARGPPNKFAFLGQVERLLSEGQFCRNIQNTRWLVLDRDLAVQLGRDDGSELDLSIRLIADTFRDLYWRQGRALWAASRRWLLRHPEQNTGQQHP